MTAPIQENGTLTKLRQMAEARELAQALGVTWDQLRFLLYRAKSTQRYRSFNIPKKSGGHRSIHAPVPQLRSIQRTTANVLAEVFQPKAAAHGFVVGRSVASNARMHLRRRWVLNVDLKDFFPSIHLGRIIGLLTKPPYSLSPKIATTLAQICCCGGKLPQGAPTSPIISNMICARLDGQLSSLARSSGAYYTRYADDLTFSTNREALPVALGRILDPNRGTVDLSSSRLEQLISGNGFVINPEKVRIACSAHTQLVTGVKVNSVPNVRRTYVRSVRAMLHSWDHDGYIAADEKHNDARAKNGKRHADLLRVVHGKIAYLKMVKGDHDPVWVRLYQYGRQLEQRDFSSGAPTGRGQLFRANPANMDPRIRGLHRATWVIENSVPETGTAFAISQDLLLTCAHCIQGESYLVNPMQPSQRYPVQVIASDKDADFAVIRVPDLGFSLTPLSLCGDQVPIGELITVAGYPEFSAGSSIIVTRGRIAGWQQRFGVTIYMSDSLIHSGASGAPVVNERGLVVGIAARGPKAHAQDPSEQMNWVVPVTVVQNFLPASIVFQKT